MFKAPVPGCSHDGSTGPDPGQAPHLPVARRSALTALAAVTGLFVLPWAEDAAAARRGAQGERRKRKKSGRRRSRSVSGSVVVAGDIEALPEISDVGDEVTSVARCGSGAVLLGCGYDLSTEPPGPGSAAALSNTVSDVVPNAGDVSCRATLIRVGPILGPVAASPQIQAHAICGS